MMFCEKNPGACSAAAPADCLQVAEGVSERRACEVLTLPRASHRYRSVADEQAALRMRIRDLAQDRMIKMINRKE